MNALQIYLDIINKQFIWLSTI